MNILQQANLYVNQMKWSVIPIVKKDKSPLIKTWKEYQKRLPAQEELQNWFSQSLNSNLAIITGSISRLCVIDADSIDGMKALEELKIYSPITVLTRKGKHYYFRCTQSIQNYVRILKDVDIRGEGGYVIAPPSIHESGTMYKWTNPSINLSYLPEFPYQLFQTNEEKKTNEPGWIGELLNALSEGNRDNSFFKICSSLRHNGYTDKDVLLLLKPHAERCGGISILEEKIKNVWSRYEPKQSGYRESPKIYSITKNWEEYCERITSKSSFQGPEISTGFPKLDTILFGLRRGEIYTIGARTGVGKTCFCINISAKLLSSNKKLLFLSTEMSFDTIWNRLFSVLSGVQTTDFDNGTVSFKSFEQFRSLPFFVSDIGNPTKEDLIQMIKEIQPDIVILDHLQHIGDAITNRSQELGLFVKSLKNIAREFNIPIIVASQLNRGADSTNIKTGEKIKPQIYHLKECGSIEEESTAVMLLNKDHQLDDTHDVYTLNVAKNRYGTTDQISIIFDKETTRMVEDI